MKKVFSLLVTGFLVVGSFGCQEAPSSNNGAIPTPGKQAAETTKITGRNIKSTPGATTIPLTGTDIKHTTIATKSDRDLKATVSKKLQLGIPGNKFVVDNKQGEIILKGIASSQEELEKAEKLVKEVQGVKTVKIEARVEPAKRS